MLARTIFRTSLCCSLLLLLACEPISLKAPIEAEATVPGSPIGGIISTFPPLEGFSHLDFSSHQALESRGLSADQIVSAQVDSFTVTLTSPDDATFDFLSSLEFVAKVGDEEVVIARKEGIDELGLSAPNPVLVLDVPDEELRGLVTADEPMSIITRGEGRAPAEDVTLEARVVFQFLVDLTSSSGD